jgi:cytochrome P450
MAETALAPLPLVPTPRSLPLWRAILNVAAANPLPTLVRLMRDEGDLVRIPMGPWVYVMVQHPDLVKQILQEKIDNYRKSDTHEALRIVVGNGLLTSEGAFWKRQRQLAQPAFHRQQLGALTETMAACAQDMAARWAQLPAGTTLDVTQEMTRLTLRIAGKTLFGVEIERDAAEFGRALDHALHFIADRSRSLIRPPVYLPTPRNVRIRRAIAKLDAVVFGIIEARRRSGEERHDLLGLLMSARDAATGESMSDEQLRDEVLTFLSAGHETTANALTWTLYLLSLHPAERRKVEGELDRVLAGRAPGLEDLPRLELTKQCVEESLRLYPPAWFLERQANEDDELGGHRIPKDTYLGICPYALHRDPRFFEDPEGFDPERFSPARSGARPRFAYLPFGAGPRTCIGAQFALWEAQLVLAVLLSRFRLDLEPGHRVALDPLVTLRSRHGMRMRLTARAGAAPIH